jgi:predicted RNA methylase
VKLRSWVITNAKHVATDTRVFARNSGLPTDSQFVKKREKALREMLKIKVRQT